MHWWNRMMALYFRKRKPFHYQMVGTLNQLFLHIHISAGGLFSCSWKFKILFMNLKTSFNINSQIRWSIISIFINYMALCRFHNSNITKVQNNQAYMGCIKRLCVFEHSVMTIYNCACSAIQRGQGSAFLLEGYSWLSACISEKRRFWRDCADAQARLNLCCLHRR